MVTLTYSHGNNFYQGSFPTVTAAYKFYIRNYATVQEWIYYYRNAHTWLDKIKDEEIMVCLFTHLFKWGCISEK